MLVLLFKFKMACSHSVKYSDDAMVSDGFCFDGFDHVTEIEPLREERRRKKREEGRGGEEGKNPCPTPTTANFSPASLSQVRAVDRSTLPKCSYSSASTTTLHQQTKQ